MATLKQVTKKRNELSQATYEYEERIMGGEDTDAKLALAFDKLRWVEAALVDLQSVVEPLVQADEEREDLQQFNEGATEIFCMVEQLREELGHLEKTQPPE